MLNEFLCPDDAGRKIPSQTKLQIKYNEKIASKNINCVGSMRAILDVWSIGNFLDYSQNVRGTRNKEEEEKNSYSISHTFR
jgi:hypothetical protein